MYDMENTKRRGRPPGTDTVCRVTVRLNEEHYTEVVKKMKSERRATIAETVRVILIEYFDVKKTAEEK